MAFLDKAGLQNLWSNIVANFATKAELADIGGQDEIYIGSGDIPAGYTLQINPEGDAVSIADIPVPEASDVGKALVANADGGYELGTVSGSVGMKTAEGGEIFNDYANNVASGEASHAEGSSTTAEGNYSHVEGSGTRANGEASHAEGSDTIADGEASHTEGNLTVASGVASHAEGSEAIAQGEYSHAEGDYTTAYGKVSHAEGYHTIAEGDYSHAEGYSTYASGDYSHVQGKYNIEDTENKYAHIVGNGEEEDTLSNAHTLDWEGNAWFQGNIKVGGTGQDDANAKAIATEEYVQNTVNNLPSVGNNLAGKKIIILGDSINAGNGWTGGFANLIQEDFPGAIVQNASVTGSHLAGEDIYYQLVSAFQAGFVPDYILVDGGGNDMLSQMVMGTVDIDTYGDPNNYGAEFDKNTTIGALERLFTNAQIHIPNAKIVFFNLYKLHPTATGVSYATQRDTWDLIHKVCQKYGIKYVDLYNEGNFTPATTPQWNTYMFDWVHINETGYRRFWPLIKSALTSI
jgi:lysophospholipase L1-like esterase